MTAKEILEQLKGLSREDRLAIAESLLKGLKGDRESPSSPVSQDPAGPSLALAANALLADYIGDEELTAFRALDSESFHAQG